jgi:hypothetical protein
MLLLMTASVVMTLMLALIAGPASARGGCEAFGQSVATDAKAPGPLGQQFVRGHAPLNDEVATEQGQLCG